MHLNFWEYYSVISFAFNTIFYIFVPVNRTTTLNANV